jgi:hypothetical protein
LLPPTDVSGPTWSHRAIVVPSVNCHRPATLFNVEGGERYYTCDRCHRGQPPEKIERLRPVAIPVGAGALTLEQAAAYLGMSDDHFREQVKPKVKVIRTGRHQAVTRRELGRWADEHGARTL